VLDTEGDFTGVHSGWSERGFVRELIHSSWTESSCSESPTG